MLESLSPTVLSVKLGISVPYASQIISGKREPSRALAIHMFRTIGHRHPVIAGLSDSEIGMLEKLEPWTPSKAAV